VSYAFGMLADNSIIPWRKAADVIDHIRASCPRQIIRTKSGYVCGFCLRYNPNILNHRKYKDFIKEEKLQAIFINLLINERKTHENKT
jgi:hypothetical protein